MALSSPLFTQEREDAASRRQPFHSPDEGLSSQSSVGHRTERPVVDQCDSQISNVRENPRRGSENQQIRILLERQKSKFSLTIKQRFKNTSSRPIMTEEESKRKFIVLIKETSNIDEINNFFMNSYQNKIGIFVKLMRKVSMRWKN